MAAGAGSLIDALEEYRSQLSQVESALKEDPNNEDLLKLKIDLEEVIDLTTDLKAQSIGDAGIPTDVDGNLEKVAASLMKTPAVANWTIGENIMAPWKTSTEYEGWNKSATKYYEALVDEVLDDGTATVTFVGYDQSANIPISQLKTMEEYKAEMSSRQHHVDTKKRKKDRYTEQQEYKKKKSQKKLERWKAMDAEREVEKNKWKHFNAKAVNKGLKGVLKASQFTTLNTGESMSKSKALAQQVLTPKHPVIQRVRRG